MEFDLSKVAKKAVQNAVKNTTYRGKPIIEWINFIANNADDLISRQAATYNLANIAKNCAKTNKQKALMGRCIYMIENMPFVQPEQKLGRWIQNKHTDTVLCSQCGKCYGDEYNYCPNCGAKMEK